MTFFFVTLVFFKSVTSGRSSIPRAAQDQNPGGEKARVLPTAGLRRRRRARALAAAQLPRVVPGPAVTGVRGPPGSPPRRPAGGLRAGTPRPSVGLAPLGFLLLESVFGAAGLARSPERKGVPVADGSDARPSQSPAASRPAGHSPGAPRASPPFLLRFSELCHRFRRSAGRWSVSDSPGGARGVPGTPRARTPAGP